MQIWARYYAPGWFLGVDAGAACLPGGSVEELLWREDKHLCLGLFRLLPRRVAREGNYGHGGTKLRCLR